MISDATDLRREDFVYRSHSGMTRRALRRLRRELMEKPFLTIWLRPIHRKPRIISKWPQIGWLAFTTAGCKLFRPKSFLQMKGVVSSGISRLFTRLIIVIPGKR